MADQQHLKILEQGVNVWNKWREEQSNIWPDLSDIRLARSDFRGFNFAGTNFREANLTETNFDRAELTTVDLVDANLTGANLSSVDLSGSDLSRADLTGGNFVRAILLETNLTQANLTNTYLYHTNFTDTKVDEANFKNARMAKTIFGNVDLSKAKGLETVRHEAPLVIGIDTIYCSNGNIPKNFLYGAGIPSSFISSLPSLVGSSIDHYSCFISYSYQDQDFAEHLRTDLQSKGVRCWFAPEDVRAGDKIRFRIEEAISLSDKFLLIISRNSIESPWIERETEMALEKEFQQKQTILFPIYLDDSITTTSIPWADALREKKRLSDFRDWKKKPQIYQKALARLTRDLKMTVATEASTQESQDDI